MFDGVRVSVTVAVEVGVLVLVGVPVLVGVEVTVGVFVRVGVFVPGGAANAAVAKSRRNTIRLIMGVTILAGRIR